MDNFLIALIFTNKTYGKIVIACVYCRDYTSVHVQKFFQIFLSTCLT